MDDNYAIKSGAIDDINIIAHRLTSEALTFNQVRALKEEAYGARQTYFDTKYPYKNDRLGRDEMHDLFVQAWHGLLASLDIGFANAKAIESIARAAMQKKCIESKRILIDKTRELIKESGRKNINSEISALRKQFFEAGHAGASEAELKVEFNGLVEDYFAAVRRRIADRNASENDVLEKKRDVIRRARSFYDEVAQRRIKNFADMKLSSDNLRSELAASGNLGREKNLVFGQELKDILDKAWDNWRLSKASRL